MKDWLFYPLLGIIALASGTEIWSSFQAPPAGMRLLRLEYINGQFVQQHEVFGVDVIDARWSAQILRDGVPLCGGAGDAPYDGGRAKRMVPDIWAGDDCPDLKPGDVALATWRWVDESGTVRRISGEITIPEG